MRCLDLERVPVRVSDAGERNARPVLAPLDNLAAHRFHVLDRRLVLDGVVDVEAHVLRTAARPLRVEQDAECAVRPRQ